MLLSGAGMWESHGVARLGIGPLRFSDGPHGMRGFSTRGDLDCTLAPCETALAATFDEALISEVGALLGADARRRGCSVLLGPCVNMQRTPLFGRHFECFSEDPFLAGKAASAYIRGVQQHVGACVKHLVANDQEDYRHSLCATVEERVLREIYLVPFEMAIMEGDVESVMCGYNRLNGAYCTTNEWLLQRVARDDWGFQGFFISDWWGNPSTVDAMKAGLNIEMPGIEPRSYGGYLLDAVRDGSVPRELLNKRCEPVLRTMLRERAANESIQSSSELLKRAAAASLVLLKNDNGLPLRRDMTLAVLGPKAKNTTLQGGGSARVSPKAFTSILDAIGDGVLHGQGSWGVEPRVVTAEWASLQSLGGCDSAGHPSRFRRCMAGMVDVLFALAACVSGMSCFRRCCMPVLRRCGLRHPGATSHTIPAARATSPPYTPAAAEERLLAEAESLAGMADACVVVVGTDGGWESEGMDQPHMRLPGSQDELVTRVAAAARGPVVVVLNVGSPKELPWLDDVSAVLLAHFGGEQMGPAVASALFGQPVAGRLPTTWPHCLEQVPACGVSSQAGEVRYGEGLSLGYRAYEAGGPLEGMRPRFPFGHGLSYTTFEYSCLAVTQEEPCGATGPRVAVALRVKNTGNRAGDEVVQLYSRAGHSPRGLCSMRRTKVLDPGEEAKVLLDTAPRGLGAWYSDSWQWPKAGDKVLLQVGASSEDIRLQETIVFQ